MSRTFDSNTANNLSVDVAAITGYPFTMACWFNADLTTTQYGLMWIGDKDTTGDFFVLFADGGSAGDPVRFRSTVGGTNSTANTTTGYTVGQWHHACAVGVSATSRSVFIDGGSKATATTSSTPAGLDRTAIGLWADSTPSGPFDGRLAECAIWDVDLTDAEVAELASGVSPLKVRPGNLVGYWNLFGRSPETNVGGDPALNLTVNGTLVVGDHAPVAPMIAVEGWPGAFTAAAAGGVVGPLIDGHIVKRGILQGRLV